MGKVVTTFPVRAEFEKARKALDGLCQSYEVIKPPPAYVRVGVPAVVIDSEARMVLAARHRDGFTCSGWVDFRPSSITAPPESPSEFTEDIFGEARIMVLAPCVADPTKIRLIAHLSGDLAGAMPFLNAVMREASFNPAAPTLTYMEGYRFIVLYPRRIAVAKADDLTDGWRVLESHPPRGEQNLGTARRSSRPTRGGRSHRPWKSTSACPRPTAGIAATRRVWPLPWECTWAVRRPRGAARCSRGSSRISRMPWSKSVLAWEPWMWMMPRRGS